MTKLNFFGKYARFHHIGIAVRSIKVISPSGKIITDHIQKVRVSFALLNGIRLEFIEPSGDNSPIIRSLKKGIKLLHLCYAVADIKEAIDYCKKYGFHRISPVALAVAFNNKIAWVYSKEYGLFELLEEKAIKKE